MKKYIIILVVTILYMANLPAQTLPTSKLGSYKGTVTATNSTFGIDETLPNITIELNESASVYSLQIESMDLGEGIVLPGYELSPVTVTPSGADYTLSSSATVNLSIPELEVPPVPFVLPSGGTFYDVPVEIKMTSAGVSGDVLSLELTATATIAISAYVNLPVPVNVSFTGTLDAPPPPKTVTVGAQDETIIAGEESLVSFPVTTTGIADGSYDIRGSVNNLPSGVNVPPFSRNLTITDGIGVLTLRVAETASAGTYSDLTLEFDATTSAPFTLIIEALMPKPITVGAQNETIIAGEASVVSFPVTTSRIADGSYMVIVNNRPTGVSVSAGNRRIEISDGSGVLTLRVTVTALAGTYSDLTLEFDGTTSAPFTLIIEAPTYSVAVTTPEVPNGGAYQFADAVVGYSAIPFTYFTIANIGTGAMTDLDVTLGGANAASFTLVKTNLNPTLASAGETSFNIKPNDGLAAGTYTTTVTITDTNIETDYTFDVSFTVSSFITSVSATITLPVDGAAPDFTAVSGEPELYTAVVSAWGDAMWVTPVTFAVGVTYNVQISFTPTVGNSFSVPMTGFINSVPVTYHASSTNESAVFRTTFTAVAGSTTLEPLTVVLTPGAGKVTLAPQTAEEGYAFYYVYSDTWETPPSFGDDISDISGEAVYSTAVDIPGEAGELLWIRVYKVETAGNTIVGYVERSTSPLDTYEIAVTSSLASISNGGSHIFTGAVAGYSSIAATTFTLENVGTGAMTDLAVALSGADAGEFTLVESEINSTLTSGYLTTFTLKPNDGLPVGTYTATVTISDANLETDYTFTVSFTVTAAPVKTVAIAAQTGVITAGTAGTATFAVTTENIANAAPATITWYTASEGLAVAPVPTGITATPTAVSDNAATVTMTATTAAQAGAYYFRMTIDDVKSNVATLTVKAKEVTGVSEVFALNLKIYPNPFTDAICITGMDDAVTMGHAPLLKVVNAAGAVVHTQMITNADETVNLGHLPSGVYMFRFEKDGKMKTTVIIKN